MLMIKHIIEWTRGDIQNRSAAAAELCRQYALDSCAEGLLPEALAFSRTAATLTLAAEAESAARSAMAPVTMADLEREWANRTGHTLQCIHCDSYHMPPTSYAHWQVLKCRRPWEDWNRTATPEEIAEWRGGLD